MDSGTAHVLTFLQIVADARAEMHRLSLQLSGLPDVAKVSTFENLPARVRLHHWDEDQQRHLVVIGLEVSAELADGSLIDWSLDISCDPQGWLVKRTVSRCGPDQDSSEMVSDFPEWQGVSLGLLVAFLPDAVTELCATAERPGLLPERQSMNILASDLPSPTPRR